MFISIYSGMPVVSASECVIRREKTVCVTGHRAKLITPYMNDSENLEATYSAVKAMLARYIDLTIEVGYENLLSGLAEGIDLWSAEHIIKSESKGTKCNLIGVMPFLKHADSFSEENKKMLVSAEESASLLITTNDNTSVRYGKNGENRDPDLYRTRNYFMVDNSSLVLAFIDDSVYRSGTAQTVHYAEQNGIPVIKFGLRDVYDIMDTTGTDMTAFKKELKKISPHIPKL